MNTNFSPIYQRVNALTQNANTQNSPQFEAARAKQQGMISAARASLNKPTLDYEKIFNQPVEQGSVAVQNPTNAITDWSQFEFESPQTKAQRIAKEQQDALTARNEAFQTSQMEKQQSFAISEREASEKFQRELQAISAASNKKGGLFGTVICTRLYKLGHLQRNIFEEEVKFGKYLNQKYPRGMYGYHWIGVPISNMMNNKTFFGKILTATMKPIFTSFGKEAALRNGTVLHRNIFEKLTGKIIVNSLIVFFNAVGELRIFIEGKNHVIAS